MVDVANLALYKASSVQEARDILFNYSPMINPSYISLDDEHRVNIDSDIKLWKLSKNGHAHLPLWFGKVTGKFIAREFGLSSLEGSPYWVGNTCDVSGNKLTSLKGGPDYVGKDYFIYQNPLVDLDGLASQIGNGILFTYTDKLPLLRTLVAKKIWPKIPYPELEKILNKYAGKGRREMFWCQKDLEDAGFEENARW
jgi:hypothetical protein